MRQEKQKAVPAAGRRLAAGRPPRGSRPTTPSPPAAWGTSASPSARRRPPWPTAAWATAAQPTATTSTPPQGASPGSRPGGQGARLDLLAPRGLVGRHRHAPALVCGRPRGCQPPSDGLLPLVPSPAGTAARHGRIGAQPPAVCCRRGATCDARIPPQNSLHIVFTPRLAGHNAAGGFRSGHPGDIHVAPTF